MIFAYLYWDPKRELLTLPIVDIPIVWYGVIFAFGFAVSYYIFTYLLRRYLLNFPTFTEEMVRDEDVLLQLLNKPKNRKVEAVSKWMGTDKLIRKFSVKKVLDAMNKVLYQQDTWKYLEPFHRKNRFKYVFTSRNVTFPERAAARLSLEKLFSPSIYSIKAVAAKITDRFAIYIILATILGARIGHLLFYEHPKHYLKNPLLLLQTWKGGLASHGGAIAILFAVYLFSKWVRKYTEELSWTTLLDLICVPTAFVAFCIRMGNFFNQEILGKVAKVPWAICFGHPLDGSVPNVPRHPVQLYEALFYLFTFFVLFSLASQTKIFLRKGKLIGLFLLMVFGFRIAVESLKLEQSELLYQSFLTMGQILSIPMIFLGLFFLLFRKNVGKEIG